MKRRRKGGGIFKLRCTAHPCNKCGWRISYGRHYQAPKAQYEVNEADCSLLSWRLHVFVQSKHLKDPYYIPRSEPIPLDISLVGYFSFTHATLEIYFICHGVAYKLRTIEYFLYILEKYLYYYPFVGHTFVVHCFWLSVA